MRARPFFFALCLSAFGAAIASGCGKRTLDVHGPGSLGLDAGGPDGTGGGGSGEDGVDSPRSGVGVIGQLCTSAADCASGFCVDGACCNASCSDECVRCDLEGHVGTCSPVRINSVCGGGSCDGDAVVLDRVCDGRGSCVAGATRICVPYHCDLATAACFAQCTTDADCIGTYCETGGFCHVRSGATCIANAECASGFCASGACCNTACTDPCTSCNLPNHEGTCWPRPDGCPGADGGTD